VLSLLIIADNHLQLIQLTKWEDADVIGLSQRCHILLHKAYLSVLSQFSHQLAILHRLRLLLAILRVVIANAVYDFVAVYDFTNLQNCM